MIQSFRNLSIKTKLTLVIMLSCTILLVVVSSVVLVAEISTSYMTHIQELRILSKSIAANSRQPLILDRYSDIETQLSALTQQDNIRAAYIFDAEGLPVAEYLHQSDSQFVLRALQNDFPTEQKKLMNAPTVEQHFITLNHFSMFTPIFYEGQQIGVLYLMSDLHRLYGRLSGVAFGITLALLVMILLAWSLAGFLHKPVSVPLLQLSHVMDEVSQLQNYSLRAEKSSGDEIGNLVDGFNRMLEQIETHQKALAQNQEYLEQMVAERTADLRSAIADLEVARQQADAANHEKSQFLSRMTHELRTPLIGVLGMNELLARTALDDQQQMFVNTVQKSGEQLLSLIGDILDLSRIEAGKLELEMGEFNLQQCVEDVVELLAPQAREKGLLFHCKIDDGGWYQVLADEMRTRQILMNLVGNAIKFTTVGTVDVCLACHKEVEDEGNFIIEVADSGCGMTKETIRQVFETFYQGEQNHRSARSGSGLGLAIVRQLVDLMGGRIELTSTVNKGSTFRVFINFKPVHRPSPGEREY